MVEKARQIARVRPSFCIFSEEWEKNVQVFLSAIGWRQVEMQEILPRDVRRDVRPARQSIRNVCEGYSLRLLWQGSVAPALGRRRDPRSPHWVVAGLVGDAFAAAIRGRRDSCRLSESYA
jgi:hypothetical protein